MKFDSLKDLRRHFETDQGSHVTQRSAGEPSELWFRSIRGWSAKTARAYLDQQGLKGDLVCNDGGWAYTPTDKE